MVGLISERGFSDDATDTPDEIGNVRVDQVTSSRITDFPSLWSGESVAPSSEMKMRHRRPAKLVDPDDEEMVVLAFVNDDLGFDA